MTRAQQTHDIFTVYRIWGMVVLLEWQTGIFSHGYPVLKSQLLGLCNRGCKTTKLCKFWLFWVFSFNSATCTPSVCPIENNENYAKKTIFHPFDNKQKDEIWIWVIFKVSWFFKGKDKDFDSWHRILKSVGNTERFLRSGHFCLFAHWSWAL